MYQYIPRTICTNTYRICNMYKYVPICTNNIYTNMYQYVPDKLYVPVRTKVYVPLCTKIRTKLGISIIRSIYIPKYVPKYVHFLIRTKYVQCILLMLMCRSFNTFSVHLYQMGKLYGVAKSKNKYCKLFLSCLDFALKI